jgi:multiple sugar transport system substrate-binding protein
LPVPRLADLLGLTSLGRYRDDPKSWFTERDTIMRLLSELAIVIDPACFDMDPIAVLETMARADSVIACAPLIYGYVSYAGDGFREAVVSFADIPSAGKGGPVGSALGGTGIAVSARTAHPAECLALASWLAGEEAQRGPYAEAGGQPAHTAAWDDPAINARSHDFYRRTRSTLDGATVRPRHNGYMGFQQAASDAINDSPRRGGGGADLVDRLNRMFEKRFR